MSKVHKITQGQTYRPSVVAEESALPYHMANAPWNYVHYPGAWEWHDQSGEFLPVLSQTPGKPGVNGAEADGRGGLDLSMSKANIGTKGGVLIPPGDARLGEHADYLIAYPVDGGGRHYCHEGMTYTVQPGGGVIVHPSKTYTAFRSALAKSSMVHPLEQWVVDRILAIEHNDLNRLTAWELNHGTSDAIKAKIAARTKRIERIEAAWAKLQEAAQPVSRKPVKGGEAVRVSV